MLKKGAHSSKKLSIVSKKPSFRVKKRESVENYLEICTKNWQWQYSNS